MSASFSFTLIFLINRKLNNFFLVNHIMNGVISLIENRSITWMINHFCRKNIRSMTIFFVINNHQHTIQISLSLAATCKNPITSTVRSKHLPILNQLTHPIHLMLKSYIRQRVSYHILKATRNPAVCSKYRHHCHFKCIKLHWKLK